MKDLFKKVMFPLNIQLFAGEEGGEGDQGGGTGDGGQGDDGKGGKTPPATPPADDKKFTQADVDAMIAKEKAKQKAKYEKAFKDGDPNDGKTGSTEGNHSEPNPYIEKYALAEIKASMMTNGIDPMKVARAVRLIDASEVLDETGEIDAEKLNKSIADLLKDWPELKATSVNGDKGFKFGSDNQKNKGTVDDLISKAFGNTK